MPNLVTDEQFQEQLKQLREHYQRMSLNNSDFSIRVYLSSAITNLGKILLDEAVSESRENAHHALRAILNNYRASNSEESPEFFKCVFDMQVVLTLRNPCNKVEKYANADLEVVFDPVNDRQFYWDTAHLALPSCGMVSTTNNLNEFFLSPHAYTIKGNETFPICPFSREILNDYEINYLLKNGVNVFQLSPTLLEVMHIENYDDLTNLDEKMEKQYSKRLINKVTVNVLEGVSQVLTALTVLTLLAVSLYFAPPLTPFIWISLFGSSAVVGGIASFQKEEDKGSYAKVFLQISLKTLVVNSLLLAASVFFIPWAASALSGSVFSTSFASVVAENLATILAFVPALTLGIGACIQGGQALYRKLTDLFKEEPAVDEIDEFFFHPNDQKIEIGKPQPNTIIRDLHVALYNISVGLISLPYLLLGYLLGTGIAYAADGLRAPLVASRVRTLDDLPHAIVNSQQNILFPPNTVNMQKELDIDPTANKDKIEEVPGNALLIEEHEENNAADPNAANVFHLQQPEPQADNPEQQADNQEQLQALKPV